MARGLRKGDGGAHLMTLPPAPAAAAPRSRFHDEDWLDFNMRQNGHVAEFTGRYDATRADYDRTPAKPVVDGEPIYEDHPVSFKATELGHSIAADVRRPLYWDLFTGACGHTYGHHSVWQMWAPGRKPINNPLMPWFEAIDQPGRRPDAARPAPHRVAAVPDPHPRRHGGRHRPRADVRARGGTLPLRGHARRRAGATPWSTRRSGGRSGCGWRPSRARRSRPGGSIPATARPRRSATFANEGEREFTPPDPGEILDWVLVLDDAAQGYPPPGAPGPFASSPASR